MVLQKETLPIQPKAGVGEWDSVFLECGCPGAFEVPKYPRYKWTWKGSLKMCGNFAPFCRRRWRT